MVTIRRRAAGAALALVLAFGLAGLGVAPSRAAQVAGVPPGQTYQGTFAVRGQTAAVQGTVDGDVSVQDHATLTVTGHVTGSVRGYGDSSVTFGRGGAVDGGVIESTGTLDIQGGARVGETLSTYNLTGRAQVDGRVGGTSRISASGLQVGRDAELDGDLWVWAQPTQRVEVDGTVRGAVHVSGTDLYLGSTAHVEGGTKVSSGKVVGGSGAGGSSAPSDRTINLEWPVGIAIVVVAIVLGVLWLIRRRRRPPTAAV